MFENLRKQLGGWTTVLKWGEPAFFRVRLKGDLLARLMIGFMFGAIATSLLLVLFAINAKPPPPWFAFCGMAVIGGLALLTLLRGRGTAGGYIRVCEEGIIRQRNYASISTQWVENSSWTYPSIQQCLLVPSTAIGQSFSLLLIVTESDVDMLGIPARINTHELGNLLAAQGVPLGQQHSVPKELCQPVSLGCAMLLCILGLTTLVAGGGFYAWKVAAAGERQVAEEPDPPARARVADMPGLPSLNLPNQPGGGGPELAPPVSRPPSTPLVTPDLPASALSPPPAIPSPQFHPGPPPNFRPKVTLHKELAQPPDRPADSPPPAAGNPSTAASAPPPASKAPPKTTPAAPSAAPSVKTDLVGGKGGFPFELVSRNGATVIGFSWSVGSWAGKPALTQLRPIYEGDRTPPGDRVAVAREGYVVGGVQVDAAEFVQAIRIVFVRRDEHGNLDKSDRYTSDWVGQLSEQPPQTLGDGISRFLGIHGRRGAVIDALGAVLAAPQN